MKKPVLTLIIAYVTMLFSCTNNTSTQMSDSSGFKQRTDSAEMPANLDEKPRGAVGIDSVKNGQVNVNGASIPDSSEQKDSTKK